MRAVLLPGVLSLALYLLGLELPLDGSSFAVRAYADLIRALHGGSLRAAEGDLFVTNEGRVLQLTAACLYIDLSLAALPWLLLASRSVRRNVVSTTLFLGLVQAVNLVRLGAAMRLPPGRAVWFLGHDLLDILLWYALFSLAVSRFLAARRIPWIRALLALAAIGAAADIVYVLVAAKE